MDRIQRKSASRIAGGLFLQHTSKPGYLFLFLFIALNVYIIIRQVRSRYKTIWYIILAGFILIFTRADITGLDRNDCEREALMTLGESSEEVTKLKDDCTVMSWEPVRDAGNSLLNAEMLEFWGITEGRKRYFQGSGQK